jgi:hypothetical protein
MTPEWVAALIHAAQQIIPADGVGTININALQGGVADVNLSRVSR